MTNIDIGAFEYIRGFFNIKTMVDVGCGPGGMVAVARDRGVITTGIDGDQSLTVDVQHNFDDGPLQIPPTDLAWAVEFLEHIEEQYLDNVFSVFGNCKYVFCTHNRKPGPWHSNCQGTDYWIREFLQRGFRYDPETTRQIKLRSTMAREFVKETGTFFINCAQIATENIMIITLR